MAGRRGDRSELGSFSVMTDLQISVETREGLERRIKVQIPAVRIENEINSRLQRVGRTAKLKGFRPGKIPAKVIRQHYGGQIRQEVLQAIVESSYSEAITQEKLRPAAVPTIEPESAGSGDDFTYTATFEIYPEIKLAGLDGLKVKRPQTEIEDADLDEMIETLRKQRANWSPVERQAAEGDRVTVDFEGRLKGEPIANGVGKAVPIVLGQGQMLHDFENNLIGLKNGSKKTFKLKFPKDYHAEELAGRKVEFNVTVGEVAAPQLPDVDQEFIKALGVPSGDANDFRQDVRSNMGREVDSRIKAEIKRQLMEQLLEANPIDLPAVLIEREAASLRNESMRNIGITDPKDPKAPGLDAFREAAKRRVRLGLLVAAVIEENKLVVDRDRVKQKVDEMCSPYDQPEEIRKLYYQNHQLLTQVENLVMEDQVVEWLISKATVSDKVTGFTELMNG
jgi:trigger factor